MTAATGIGIARAALALLLVPHTAGASPEIEAQLDRVSQRAETLGSQADAARRLASARAFAAYRLARRGSASLADAQAARAGRALEFGLALAALERSLGEARTLDREIAALGCERETLLARAPAPAAGPMPVFAPPVRAPVLRGPGARRDGATGIETRGEAVEWLARMSQPVRAPAAGVVRRIEPLPQGGFALVLDHGAGWTSVLTGLRSADVDPGARVERGAAIGRAGRNLDGAPVVGWDLWRGRQAVDPRRALGGAR